MRKSKNQWLPMIFGSSGSTALGKKTSSWYADTTCVHEPFQKVSSVPSKSSIMQITNQMWTWSRNIALFSGPKLEVTYAPIWGSLAFLINTMLNTASITTSWLHSKRVWLLNWLNCTKPFGHHEIKNAARRPRIVEQVKSFVRLESDNISEQLLESFYKKKVFFQ